MAGMMVVHGLRWPRGRTLLALIGMGAVLYVGEAMLFFHAAQHIPVPLVSLLLYIYPVIVTVFAWLFLRERMTPAKLLALGLAIAGLVLTILPEIQNGGGHAPKEGINPTLGVLLGIGTAIAYSIYILIGGRYSREAGAVPASTIVIGSTALVIGAMTLSRGDALPQDQLAWMGVLGLAIVSTVISITCLLAGLQRIGPVQSSTLSTLEPVTTAIVGATLMNDRLTMLQIIGGGLILVAAVIIARAGGAAEVADPEPH
jgi:drug/metabolite transporter (DMT)-like permease